MNLPFSKKLNDQLIALNNLYGLTTKSSASSIWPNAFKLTSRNSTEI